MMEGARGSVLLVDDEPAVRAFVATVLRGAGYQVTAVSNGEQALAAGSSAGDPFDAVITDLRLPGMSGSELIRRLEDDRGDLRVIVISGIGADSMRDQLGERSYPLLEKPFGAVELLRCVEGLIESASPS